MQTLTAPREGFHIIKCPWKLLDQFAGPGQSTPPPGSQDRGVLGSNRKETSPQPALSTAEADITVSVQSND